MRQILFRGKRTDNGKWVEGMLARYNPDFEVANMVDSQFDLLVPVDTKTVGQDTGLTDKDGKKIFEGDILRYSYEYEGSPWMKGRSLTDEDYRMGVVFWQSWRGTWAVCLRGTNQACNQDVFVYCRNPNRVEVIGNIHDNLELLKGGE